MKHQCTDCHKVFLYPAKLTVSDVSVEVKYQDSSVAQATSQNTSNFESSVCPYCKSLNIEAAVNVEEDVSSVVQVEYAQADAYLKMGYKIKEYYAKVVTLVKVEVK